MTQPEHGGRWVEVPPPAKAPVDEIAALLGLCSGLRAERNSQYRCASCSKMQPDGSWLIWVSDSVRRGDPAWSVTEAARRNAFNGHSSGWCLACAQSLTPRPAAVYVGPIPDEYPLAPVPERLGILARFVKWLRGVTS